MTVVIYKEHRIEIEREGNIVSYSIWDQDKFLVANDDVELPLNTVIKDCQSLVDEYLESPENFR